MAKWIDRMNAKLDNVHKAQRKVDVVGNTAPRRPGIGPCVTVLSKRVGASVENQTRYHRDTAFMGRNQETMDLTVFTLREDKRGWPALSSTDLERVFLSPEAIHEIRLALRRDHASRRTPPIITRR